MSDTSYKHNMSKMGIRFLAKCAQNYGTVSC